MWQKTSLCKRIMRRTLPLLSLLSLLSPLIITAGSAVAALMAKFGVVSVEVRMPTSKIQLWVDMRTEFGVMEDSQWLNSYLHERETSKADDTAGMKRR